MIYLHTSALLRLIHQGAEGLALGEWLNERCTEVILTSVISEVELTHTLRRTQPDQVPQIPALLAKISTYEVDELVRRVAAGTPDATLSSACMWRPRWWSWARRRRHSLPTIPQSPGQPPWPDCQ